MVTREYWEEIFSKTTFIIILLSLFSTLVVYLLFSGLIAIITFIISYEIFTRLLTGRYSKATRIGPINVTTTTKNTYTIVYASLFASLITLISFIEYTSFEPILLPTVLVFIFVFRIVEFLLTGEAIAWYGDHAKGRDAIPDVILYMMGLALIVYWFFTNKVT